MDMKVSVALASYNGEEYIGEQLHSVASQLPDGSEIVVSDDGSSDGTEIVVRDIRQQYKNIDVRFIKGPCRGVKKNFENAIRNCEGDIIFLCDQDDIWEQGKVESVCRVFEKSNVTAVVHDCSVIDADGNVVIPSFFEYKRSGAGVIKNIAKNTYIGCCMAFSSSLKEKILPIPDDIEMHDQWIGILSDRFGLTYFLQKRLLRYRRHGANSSDMDHYGIGYMIKKRVIILKRFLAVHS